jgi:IS4 transposase
MKQNRSLAITQHILDCRAGNIIGLLETEFPLSIFNNQKEDSVGRKRVFTHQNTLLTMVLTATQQDKTLKNSVDIFYGIHQEHKQRALNELEQQVMQQKELNQSRTEKKAGRPPKYNIQLPKSLDKDISLNTAAYSKARDRISPELTEDLFKASHIANAVNDYSHWHGYRVLIGDGTYVQTQDTESLRKDYEVKHNDVGSEGYPQGLLEVLIDRGTGQINCFQLANRHVSELPIFYEIIDKVEAGSIILADDLYNCFEIISKCKRKGIELLIPAKRERSYEVVEVIAPGDEIIRIKTPKNRSKWLEQKEPANTFLIRRICCISPDGNEYVLHTTILNSKISKEEFHLLYLTRWDIEIGIREIKTIMDINILRSKTPEMALKELRVALATYNMIRKLIYANIKGLPFSPKGDFIQRFYTINKDIHVDKKGRIYNRWSTGRRRNQEINLENETTKAKAQ